MSHPPPTSPGRIPLNSTPSPRGFCRRRSHLLAALPSVFVLSAGPFSIGLATRHPLACCIPPCLPCPLSLPVLPQPFPYRLSRESPNVFPVSTKKIRGAQGQTLGSRRTSMSVIRVS